VKGRRRGGLSPFEAALADRGLSYSSFPITKEAIWPNISSRGHSLENLNESRAVIIERAAGMTYQDDENRDILLFLCIDEPTEEEAGADTGEWEASTVAEILTVIEEEY
jgi:hypothetical protein